MLTYNEFINELVNSFPELKDEVLDEDKKNLVALQVAVLCRYAQKAIDENDSRVIERCFNFVTGMIKNTEFKVENALYISFLGKLDFSQNKRAKKLLSDDLIGAYDELQKHYQNSEKNDKLKAFLRTLEE